MRLELTKRGAYAVRAMLALSRLDEGRILSGRLIAEEMAIPPRFLPQVMGDLTHAGLVVAHPGRSGGYALAKSPADITILQVVDAVERDNRRQTCVLRGGPCGPENPCEVHVVFFSGEDSLRQLLGAATLAMVVDRKAVDPWTRSVGRAAPRTTGSAARASGRRATAVAAAD
ncbi:MAG TPA: Rrf2 family transcriptional regulator [Candidatus Limnocylindrales bacterium]